MGRGGWPETSQASDQGGEELGVGTLGSALDCLSSSPWMALAHSAISQLHGVCGRVAERNAFGARRIEGTHARVCSRKGRTSCTPQGGKGSEVARLHAHEDLANQSSLWLGLSFWAGGSVSKAGVLVGLPG